MHIYGYWFTPLELIIAGTLLFFFIWQIVQFIRVYGAVLRYNKKQKKAHTLLSPGQPSVSVIICARDEAENLRDNIPHIVSQNYPEFEVIVVNDGSTDETEHVLTNLKDKYPNLRSTFVPYGATNLSTKKLALTLGIKAAKYDWVLLTDADCVPNSNNWISAMAKHFHTGTEIVLGYGAYTTENKGLNKLITFDTLLNGLQYLGFAILGKPYMGVGRNLAYRKEVFFRLKGFASNLHLRSGDDDLLVNAAANRHNTKVEASPESITWSKPSKSLREWFYQKERHLSVSSFYTTSSKTRLIVEPITRMLFYISFIAAFVFGNHITMAYAGFLFLIRFAVQLSIINRSSKQFGGRRYFISVLTFDLLLPLLSLFMLTFGKMGKKSKQIVWK